MSFKKEKFIVIKKAISRDLSIFVYNYFCLKKQIYQTMREANYISPYTKDFGNFGDGQVPKTYSYYSDTAMETLLIKLQEKVEKHTKLKLVPNYSYARLYEKGDELKRHKDRFSCEISTTLFLGGDQWPIYVEPSGKIGMKGKKINLNVGDMLIYKGRDLEHWREPFTGEICAQVFLHYNNVKTPEADLNIFDTRKHIGLPLFFKSGVNRW